ncbi:CBS domain-containing protein [Nocardia cyriacigeorgica]|uniref:Zinc metalloprotease n=1 Tax=Nocardia cyriacigeorgica TaxID=135487 RepID=A0A6P1CND5_9NOCA|nr:site-2 protease family protein [Nocardia cyriacigeorgica]NEW34080.1 CBS domain-containing protein [Nocardia cyriacigeorgica]
MLRATIPLGTVSGIRLGAHWSALVTLGLFTWLLGGSLGATYGNSTFVWLAAAGGAAGLIATLMIHELAHSVVAQRDGVPVEQVVLWLLGGVSELATEPPSVRSDLRIAAAGPLTSLALGLGLIGLAAGMSQFTSGPILGVVAWLGAMNVVLAVFNMLPGAPLDGGRILRALLWWRSGDQLRAAALAARWGRAMGLGFMAVGAAELILVGAASGLWLLLLGWFLFTAASTELAAAGLRHQLGDVRVRDVMTTSVTAIPSTWSVDDLLMSSVPDSGHQVFPVVDDNESPVAVLAWSDVVGVPMRTRAKAMVSEVARPLPARARVLADDKLSDVAARVVLRPDLDIIAVVDSRGRAIGLVTAGDVAHACRRSELGLPIGPLTATDRSRIAADRPGGDRNTTREPTSRGSAACTPGSYSSGQ